MARRVKTLDQVRKMQAKAVRFVQNVLQDDERAAEIAAESPAEYAEHKRIKVIDNPAVTILNMRRHSMAGVISTKAELEKLLDDVEGLSSDALDPELSREEVVAKVKEIYDLVSSDEEEDEDEDESEPGSDEIED